ncbi:hypothetical protein PC111_g10818 [Phytophthora cactorum]|nr:hypothetical protein PC111_g10818 [Phytophthora cactorum]
MRLMALKVVRGKGLRGAVMRASIENLCQQWFHLD